MNMRRIWKGILVTVSVLVMFCINYSVTNAETDRTAPVCTGIELKNTSVIKPNYLSLSASFVEEGTGISHIFFIVLKKGEDQYLNGLTPIIYFDYYDDFAGNGPRWVWTSNIGTQIRSGEMNLENKFFTESVSFDLYVGDYADPGDYYIGAIKLTDAAGNQSEYYSLGCCGSPNDGHDLIVGERISYYQYNEVDRYSKHDAPKFEAATWFEVKDEFDYQFEKSLSNPSIRNSFGNVEEGKAVKLLADSKAIVPKEAFDAIKGKDSRIVAYNDKYQWIFYGKDIINETKDVDVSLAYNKTGASVFNTGEDSCLIEFQNNGLLPGKAEVRIASDYAYDLYNSKNGLFLYYVNGSEASLEKDANIGVLKDADKKWCKFDITHNSEFVLSGSEICLTVLEKMTLNTTALTIQAGKTSNRVRATLVNDSIVAVTSSKESVATATFSGNIIKVKAGKTTGKATITVTSKSGVVKTFTVTVQKDRVVTKTLTVGKKALTLNKKGATATVKVKATPDSVSTMEPLKINLSAKDKEIVDTKYDTTTGNLTITALKAGTANIKITAGKKNSSIKVTVKIPVEVEKVKLSKTKLTLAVKKSATLKATITPAKASNKKIVWTSDNKSVATVTQKGKVTAKAPGKAKITVTTKDGGKTASCEVIVTAAKKKK